MNVKENKVIRNYSRDEIYSEWHGRSTKNTEDWIEKEYNAFLIILLGWRK